jgi:hypothetical protein
MATTQYLGPRRRDFLARFLAFIFMAINLVVTAGNRNLFAVGRLSGSGQTSDSRTVRLHMVKELVGSSSEFREDRTSSRN